MNLIVSAIGQGFLWGLLGLGLFLSFRIMNTTDMTVEGTFPLGAAVSVSLIAQGTNPFLATLAAFVAGGLAWPGHGHFDHQGQDSQPFSRDFDHDRDLLYRLDGYGQV